MRKTTRLKELILAPEILVMPGAHDSLVARIIEQMGFQAVTLGGYPATANLLGKPDVSLLTMTEMVEYTRRICGAVDLPVFTDGDTGYGNVTNVFRTVKEMERAGAAGMFIEDQVFRNGRHMEGKQVIQEEMLLWMHGQIPISFSWPGQMRWRFTASRRRSTGGIFTGKRARI
jgi:methylisocitrate lyase